MTEIIFAGRNKNYGAYILRSGYGNTLMRSVSLMGLGCITFFSIAWFISNRKEHRVEIPSEQLPPEITTVIEYNSPPPEPEPQQPAARSVPATINTPDENTAVRIVDSVAIEPETPLNDRATEGSSVAVAGSEAGNNQGSKGEGAKPGFEGGTCGGISHDYQVDSAPEFEGGLKALNRFLGNNLRYPETARDEGKEGVVHVKFVVDEKGEVTLAEALNKPGYGMEQEALRVVAMIPKFKSPAKVKGKPVKVYFNIPIKFSLR